MGVWDSAFVMFNGFFSDFLTPFTLGGHNFLSFNLFFMIFSVLIVPRRGLQVLFVHQKQQSTYLVVILQFISSWNLQWIFYPISFGFHFYLAQYINRSNNLLITKHEVPLGMSTRIKLDFYEVVILKNKMDYPNFT